uniref:Uncharacterized protein n=1 Tax=Leersia perrieri TaxID=77586 RepID=A0A0D9VAC1_9ORYZ
MGRRKSRESLRPSSLVPFDLPAASIPNPRHRGDLGRRPLAVQQRAWLRTALPPPDAVMQERELPPLLPYGFTQQIANYQGKGSSFQIRWIGDTIEPIPDIIANAMAEVDCCS